LDLLPRRSGNGLDHNKEKVTAVKQLNNNRTRVTAVGNLKNNRTRETTVSQLNNNQTRVTAVDQLKNSGIGDDFMTFKGRTGIIIWIVALILLACEVFFFLFKDDFENQVMFWILVIVFALILILTLMFEIRNKIVVTKDLLKICFGLTTTNISVSTITSLKKTFSAIASDSASLRRIEIVYTNQTGICKVYCSPRKEDDFIKLLAEYNPKVKILG